MCKFSHFSRRNRSTTSKFVTLTFVVSLIVHGLAQFATAIWILVNNYSACAFLQKYHVPVYMHLTSGVSAVLVAVFSIVCFYCYKSHVRYFICGIVITVSLELSCILSAVILDNMIKPHLPVTMKNSFVDTLNHLNTSETGGDLNCWTEIQEKYNCCGLVNYSDWCMASFSTQCSFYNNDLIESCGCNGMNEQNNNCIVLNNDTVVATPCLSSVSDRLTNTFTLVIVMDSVFCVMQCVMFMAVNFILAMLNSKAAVDTYKQKSTEAESRL